MNDGGCKRFETRDGAGISKIEGSLIVCVKRGGDRSGVRVAVREIGKSRSVKEV